MKKIGQSKVAYGILTCCMLAISIGAWGAASGNGGNIEETAPEITYSVFNIPEDVDVDIKAEGIPDERVTEAETETTEVTTIISEDDNTPYTGNFSMPTASTFITKDYSNGAMVYSNTMTDWRVHTGIDFGESRGQSVMAIQDGTVLESRADALWGAVLVIDHGQGLVAKYCGLAADNLPEIGCHIEKYAVIGTIDEIPIECKDGPHLHFEVTVDGKQVDPLKAINHK